MDNKASSVSFKADPRGNGMVVTVRETFSTTRFSRADLLCRPRLTQFLREQAHPFEYSQNYPFQPDGDGASGFSGVAAMMTVAAGEFAERSRAIRDHVEAQAARLSAVTPICIEAYGPDPDPHLMVSGLRWRPATRSTVDRDDDDILHVILLDELIGLPDHGHSSGGIDVLGFLPGTEFIELNVRKTFSSKGAAAWYSLATGERMPAAKLRRVAGPAELAAV